MAPRTAEDGPRVLSADAFAFELNLELRRAVRSRSYLTLVVMEASRASETKPEATTDVVQEIAAAIADKVRDTDLLGHTASGTLSLLLLDTDVEHSTCVINRLVGRIDQGRFATPVRIAVGAACYPKDGVDADTLSREAKARPVTNWQG